VNARPVHRLPSIVAPGIRTGEPYTRADLRRDVLAGVLLSTLLVPAGMGYAEVAGLPPSSGLHATVAALVAYALVGPSRILVIGPDSSLAPIIGAAIVPLAAGPEGRALALAGLLALLVGAVLVAVGLLRLGWITALVSKPVRVGYLNGIAIVVIVGQLPTLLGFTVDGDGLVDELRGLVRGVRDGAIDRPTAVLGVVALVTIVGLRRIAPRAPGMLLAVAGGAGAVVLFDLDVEVIGALPRGLPAPALTGLRWDDVGALAPAAAGIALVALADTAALTRSLNRGRVNDNREMGVLGLSNVASGLFGGFPVSGSASRTPAARESGARTQIASLVGAATVTVLLLVAPGLTRHVPAAALAAVVIAAVLKVADVAGAVALWRMNHTDFALGVAAFLGVALVGVLEGIAVAAALSIAAFVAKAWRPHTAQLVRVEGRKGYHDAARHPTGQRIPGLVLLRFDAPLFFANSDAFVDFVWQSVEEAPSARWVVLAAEPVTDIDTTAAEGLVDLDDELEERGIRLVFAELKGPVKDRLAQYGLDARFADRYFPTLGTAVNAYLAQTGTEYTDWTDRAP
jgi:high affinity sulfate transporter 1